MTRIFNYCRIDTFPQIELGVPVETGGQLGAFRDYPNRGAHSIIKYLGVSEHNSFHKYAVEHETQRNMRHRYNAEILNSVVEIKEFNLFQHTKEGYFMIDAAATDIRDLYRRISDTYPQSLILLKLRTTNLRKLCEDIDKKRFDAAVTGGHFHDLNLDRVNSASVFGNEVGDSPLWNELETKGELGGVTITFPFYGDQTSVMVTRSGGILIYSSFKENLALEVVETLNKLIAAYCDETDLSRKPRR